MRNTIRRQFLIGAIVVSFATSIGRVIGLGVLFFAPYFTWIILYAAS